MVRIRDGVELLAESRGIGPNDLRAGGCWLADARRSAGNDAGEKDGGIADGDTPPTGMAHSLDVRMTKVEKNSKKTVVCMVFA